jgi:hypothetical protein
MSMDLRADYSPPPETPRDLREAIMGDFIRSQEDKK